MDIELPYFLSNKDWFIWDDKKHKYFLTEKATIKAKASYIDYYKEQREFELKKHKKMPTK